MSTSARLHELVGRLRSRTSRRGGAALLSAQVTTPLTIAAVTLGYLVGGASGAAVTGLLTLLSCPVAALSSTCVQLIRAGKIPPEDGGPAAAVVASAATPPRGAAGGGAVLSLVAGGRYGPDSFWGALTLDERRALLAVAQGHLFHRDDVLCSEGWDAREVIVILSGWTRVWVQEGAEQRIVAFRGAGELVGERAALTVRARSATVTAEENVEAARIGADDFSAFLAGHPRVGALLERQLYRRVVEERAPRVPAPQPVPGRPAAGRSAPGWSHGNCSVLITDITGFSSPCRTDDDRRFVLDAMYRILDDSFAASGLGPADRYQEDRGDGALVIVPPATPTRAVVDPMLAHLAAGLRRHNRQAGEATRLQLRAALNVGPVERRAEGVAGLPIITARRMVDAPAVKRRVAETGADLGFVTSDSVYDTVIRQAPGLVDPGRYSRVRVRVKETSLSAWMCLEGGSSWLKAG